MIVGMTESTKTFPKHACQFYGCERKLVQTLIDDEFFWDEKDHTYVPNGFTDTFEYTGYVYCPDSKEWWTGA
jgi:hypothetical protein